MPLRRRPSRDEQLREVYRENVAAVYAFLAYSVSRDVAEDLTLGHIRAGGAVVGELRPGPLERPLRGCS